MDNVAEKLDNINKTLEKIQCVLDKPKSKFVQWLVVVGYFAIAFSILQVFDTVIGWFTGGN
jgi:hypothetical protein